MTNRKDGLMTARRGIGLVALAVYVTMIVLANWAIGRYGFIWGPVGLVPAGTYFAGAVFVARDFIQVTFGRWFVLAAIAAGALLSWQVSPSFAMASAVAFGLGELADWAIFTPLIQRGQIMSSFVLANTVGCLFDTLIFLQLAFHSTAHWNTTFVGKVLLTAPTLALRFVGRKTVKRWAVGA